MRDRVVAGALGVGIGNCTPPSGLLHNARALPLDACTDPSDAPVHCLMGRTKAGDTEEPSDVIE